MSSLSRSITAWMLPPANASLTNGPATTSPWRFPLAFLVLSAEQTSLIERVNADTRELRSCPPSPSPRCWQHAPREACDGTGWECHLPGI